MNIICQTEDILDGTKSYGINFLQKKDAVDKTGVSYKVLYGIVLCFNTKAYIVGVGIPIFKVTE